MHKLQGHFNKGKYISKKMKANCKFIDYMCAFSEQIENTSKGLRIQLVAFSLGANIND